jgi:hypothetical protein
MLGSPLNRRLQKMTAGAAEKKDADRSSNPGAGVWLSLSCRLGVEVFPVWGGTPGKHRYGRRHKTRLVSDFSSISGRA